MQIVRELGGYSLGRADLVRRAMSKKKEAVMMAERKNFVYGNPEENVPGCAAHGISDTVANQIFDTMTDFAKYAFNKSHAACYAVVAYETAWLKYYYPKEFMAAMMTSVIENSDKVSFYIDTCRQLKIELLPPDINQGRGEFSVQDGKIRYGLNAIKGIGKAVVQAIVKEREANGPFRSVKDFMERLTNKEVNKKTLENFIKAGAFACFPQTRKQQMAHYPVLLEQVEKTRKDSLSGQISFFDFDGIGGFGEEGKKLAEASYPDIGEYDKRQVLEFEKEVLGIYISGHPLEEYTDLLKKNATARAIDFVVDEEQQAAVVGDGEKVTVGGMVIGKTVKTTRNGQLMAFVTLEDMTGEVELIVFPKPYEQYRNLLDEERKVLVQGRASFESSSEEAAVGRIVLERLVPFENVPKELWLQFQNRAEYDAKLQKVLDALAPYDGNDHIGIFLKEEKARKILPSNYDISAEPGAIAAAKEILGDENVGVVAKKI